MTKAVENISEKETKTKKKVAAEKAPKATTKKETVKKETVKKAATKKTTVKKETVKKETTKKATRKTSAKKVAAKVEEIKVETKLLQQDFYNEIQRRKWAAHDVQWLYIELNAKELSDEMNGNNPLEAAWAMLDTLLEGDIILNIDSNEDLTNGDLTCRFYVDNLSDSRKKYSFE